MRHWIEQRSQGLFVHATTSTAHRDLSREQLLELLAYPYPYNVRMSLGASRG